MIVSHRHRFVFVKTRKTAGTSIEVLLERIAGDDAVVTTIAPPVSGHVPRHDVGYFNHMSATEIRARLGADLWRSYFTFCFERNPWDKTVSHYFFLRSRGFVDVDFREHVLSGRLPSDFDLYSLDRQTVGVDFVGRFDHLEDDLRRVIGDLDLGCEVELTREKADTRPPGSAAARMFDDETSALVESVFAREINVFGFRRPTLS